MMSVVCRAATNTKVIDPYGTENQLTTLNTKFQRHIESELTQSIDCYIIIPTAGFINISNKYLKSGGEVLVTLKIAY